MTPTTATAPTFTVLPAWVPAAYGQGAMFMVNYADDNRGAEILARIPWFDPENDDNADDPAFTGMFTGTRYTARQIADTFRNVEWFKDFDMQKGPEHEYDAYRTFNMDQAEEAVAGANIILNAVRAGGNAAEIRQAETELKAAENTLAFHTAEGAELANR